MFYEIEDLPVVGVKFLTGGSNGESIVKALHTEEQVAISENRFGAVGAEREGLFEGEFGLFDHPLLGHRVFVVGIVDPPGVNAADGAPKFAEGFLPLVIADE